MRVLVLLALLVSSRPQDRPQPKFTAYRGAKVYTGAGAPLEQATILLEGARIHSVGKDVAIPPDATVIDASGKVIVPGLIDGASRLFLDPPPVAHDVEVAIGADARTIGPVDIQADVRTGVRPGL